MPHQKHKQKLGRTADHRMAMLNNLAISVILYEQVSTTTAKAKAVQPIVEKLISKSKLDTLHHRRQVRSQLHNDDNATRKLFEVLGKRFAERDGGYTSLIRLGNRNGDNAPMTQIRLIDTDQEATA